MTEHTGRSPEALRITTYVVLGVIFLILTVIALFTFQTAKAGKQANEKAAQLQEAFRTAGLPVPSTEQITRVLGDDGGAMCTDPVNALRQATLKNSMSNGAAGPGMRPVIADESIVQGELLAIGIYCPEKQAEFVNYIKDNYDLEKGVAK